MTEKIEDFWVDATADDVAGIVNTGKLVPARFRDSGADNWEEYSLAGWKFRRSGARWIDFDGVTWNFCQVYREPSWWTDKPDPGPEHRLLGKLPDEELKPGDEAWDKRDDKQWAESDNAKLGTPQSEGIWYRRRIEKVEPEPKHYVLRVGDSVETPSGHRMQVISRGEPQSIWALTAGDKLTLPNGQTITITAKGFEVEQ